MPALVSDELWQAVEPLLPQHPPSPRGDARAVPTALASPASSSCSAPARPGASCPHGSGPGKTRYVVERTPARFANCRRIRHCYERTWHSWQALNELAACLICANRLRKVRQQGTQATPPRW